MKTNTPTIQRCNFCGQQAPIVWVHGHGQCSICGTNSQACCQGEQCQNGVMKPSADTQNNTCTTS